MANGKIDMKNCSKQEIIDVIKAAKSRKQAWEERVQAEMRERLISQGSSAYAE